MNKRELLAAFVAHLETELLAIKEAARATHEAVTHEDAKPENEYDTRAIENSYLAGAQAKRAGEIDEILSSFRTVVPKDFGAGDAVSATALVELDGDGKKNTVFVMPKGGGFSLNHGGKTIRIVTPQSHLGEALLGRRAGDEIDVEIGDQTRTYEILSVK